MASRAADVFVSYKAEDRSRLIPLIEALEGEGLSIWWDAQIGGGTNWRQDIEEHLNAAKCVLVVWTKRSVGPDGEFVRDEAGQAKKLGTYLPVRLDAVELPLGFREVQAISLKGWHGDRADPRFLAVSAAVRQYVAGEPIRHQPARGASPRISRRTLIAGGTVGALALGGVGGWVLLRRSVGSVTGSIAVLPFENLSGDPSQSYFSDGIAEELRSALARIPQLKVAARTSSEKVRDDDAKTAAEKLGVANILTGSVRRSPQLIRVDAQLVDGDTGLERWSQTFDRPIGDVLAIQTNIAENVAEALSIQLVGATKTALTLGGTNNPAALDLYLQTGRGSGSPDGFLHEIAQLDAAIQLDPNYAQAYASKAAALSTYGGTYAHSVAEKASFLARATAAAQRAIQLAPKLPEGHTALSFVYRNELRLKDADREIGTAVSLPGAEATTWASYGVALVAKGGGTEVPDAISRATQLDPLNPIVFVQKAWTLFAVHRYPSAIAAAQEALRIEPSLASARRYLGYSLIMMRRYDEATAEFSKLPKDNVQAQTARAIIAAAKGDLKASDQLIAQMEQVNGDTANYQYAQVYAQRKDSDAAIRFLNKAFEARDPGLASLRADPFFDPIRGDPRFAEIVRKLNFST